MKNQTLFSLKDKSKKLKCHLLQFLFDTLRVNFSETGFFITANSGQRQNFWEPVASL